MNILDTNCTMFAKVTAIPMAIIFIFINFTNVTDAGHHILFTIHRP